MEDGACEETAASSSQQQWRQNPGYKSSFYKWIVFMIHFANLYVRNVLVSNLNLCCSYIRQTKTSISMRSTGKSCNKLNKRQNIVYFYSITKAICGHSSV